MKSLCLAIVVGGLLFVASGANAGVEFSIDPASSSVDGNVTPDDVLTHGPTVVIQGSSLGLRDDFFVGEFDNLNALSHGNDPINRPAFFSVDRVAAGVSGSAVDQQSLSGDAAGDVYQAQPPFGSNVLHINEVDLGLLPGFFGDDLDALSMVGGPSTYFSIDQLSASNGFGAGTLANDIFVDSVAAEFAGGETHIGLDPYDDLDALVLWDVGTPGRLDPGLDMALFSLSVFSPSTFTFTGLAYDAGVPGQLSPADILQTDFTGSFSLWADALSLGLLPDDELDALATLPEPMGLLIWGGLFTAAAVTFRGRRRGSHAR